MYFTSYSTPHLISRFALYIVVCVLAVRCMCRKLRQLLSPASLLFRCCGGLFTVLWLTARLLCVLWLLFGWENWVCWWAVGLWGPVNWIKGQHLWGVSQESQLTQHVLSQVRGAMLESQLPVFVNTSHSAISPFVEAKNLADLYDRNVIACYWVCMLFNGNMHQVVIDLCKILLHISSIKRQRLKHQKCWRWLATFF